jgi:hypothetical protein
MFHGTYLKSDVTFLLKVIDIKETEISQKERAIQSGKKHYSEMISPEYVPSSEYLEVFHQSMRRNLKTFAQDMVNFATLLPKDIVILSLARAGTPIGVITKRIIFERYGLDTPHYSISIIRDREIDNNALKYVLQKHPDKKIIFLDGWTGKGVIGSELRKFVNKFNRENGTDISSDLFVVADISGKAQFSVTNNDYMIPSSALNSTISGLVSRTILNREYVSESDFHGCRFYSEFNGVDITLSFVEKVVEKSREMIPTMESFLPKNIELEKRAEDFILDAKKRYRVSTINFIKPGVAETTRVLLRRVPDRILVKDRTLHHVEHLIHLASEKGVKVEEIRELPYSAVGIIEDMKL